MIKRLFFPLLLIGTIKVFSQADSALDIINMSIEELLNLEVKTSNITGLKSEAIPASITVISKQEIENTPSRNIYDLIETYVPGATWANHYDGPHVGIRFAPSDRNYKYMLLVNGVNLNQKSHNGASSELENWDLSDIEKIEVIRGPGAVTFGPGAILGVINIVTREPRATPVVMAKVSYAFPYNTYGSNLSYSFKNRKVALYTFASVMQLGGYNNADMFRVEKTPSGGYAEGYIGKGQEYAAGQFVGNAPALSYMKSRSPQVKLHAGLHLGKEWEMMLRYTSSDIIGQYVYPQVRDVKGVTSESEHGITGERTVEWGDYHDYGYVKHRVASALLKNNHAFNRRISLQSKITAKTHDYDFAWNDFYFSHAFNIDTVCKYHQLGSLTTPQDPAVEMGRNWCENELSASELLNWNPTLDLKLAFGGEWSVTRVQPGWGDDRNEMIAGESWDFYSDENSLYVQKGVDKLYQHSRPADKSVFIGDGFSTNTFSLLSEANVILLRGATLLVSGRLDKNQYIKWLVSPRAALIIELSNKHFLKFIAQQSQRMNTLNQLYLNKQFSSKNEGVEALPIYNPTGVKLPFDLLSNKGSDNENLTGFEAIYSYNKSKATNFSIPLYYNIIDNLGVSRGTGPTPTISTYRIGRFSCVGVEPEFKTRISAFDIGVNHSLYIPLKWKLTDSTGQRNITSVGDWNYPVSYGDQNVRLTSSSANLMLWSNHTSKLWTNIRLMKGKIVVHVNTHCFWKFEGGQDMMSMYQKAAKGTVYEERMNELIDKLGKRKVFGTDMRINAGISYAATKNLALSLSAMNIASTGNAKRYTLWEFWNDYPNPAYVEEPLALFGKLSYTIK